MQASNSDGSIEHLLPALIEEARRGWQRYGNYNSTHEGLGVLTEEFAELVDAIRSNQPEEIGREAIQVAAVAIRLAQACQAIVTKDGAVEPTPFLLRSLP